MSDLVALLGGNPLFSACDEESLHRIVVGARELRYRDDEVIFRQGDSGDRCFVIMDGVVKVSLVSVEGAEMLLATLGPPESFGELSVIDGGPRSATATALGPTTTISIERRTLMEVVAVTPTLADALFRALGALVRHGTEHASDIVFLDLAGRVAKAIVELAARFGHVEGEGVRLTSPLSQREIGEMVGGSRQSVNHILGTFERRGWIEVHGRELRIVVLDELERRAAR
jgi:CRP/FNR family transcriptional regulator, cyclic AMP receptor protein